MRVSFALSLIPACGRRAEHSATARPPRVASGGMLTIADVPPSALAALHVGEPTFTPWDTAKYSAADRARVHRSVNEGIVVVRGDLRGVGAVDYAIAGRTSRAPMIIALLARPNGAYDVSVVTDGGRDAAAATGEPPVLLQIEPSQAQDAKLGALDIVVHSPGALPIAGPPRFTWVPARSRFLMVGDPY